MPEITTLNIILFTHNTKRKTNIISNFLYELEFKLIKQVFSTIVYN